MNSDSSLEDNHIIQIVKGIVIAVVFTLILLFVFSLLLAYTELTEEIMPTVIIIVSTISILLGSSIINLKIKKNGIINGAIIGGCYIILLYVISSLLIGSFSLNISSIIMIIAGIIAGMLGGIIGVNIK